MDVLHVSSAARIEQNKIRLKENKQKVILTFCEGAQG